MDQRALLTIVGVAGAAMIALAPAPAAAQTAAKPLSVILSFDGEHHDNVARASATQAALRGLVPADEIYRPSLAIDLNKALGPHTISLSSQLGYTFYARNTRLNRERIQVQADLALRLSTCQLVLSPSYSRAQTDLADLASVPGQGIGTIRNVESVQAYTGALACGGSVGFAPTARITRTIADNSSLQRQFSNHRSTRYLIGLRYSQPALGVANLSGGIVDIDYPNRPLVGGVGVDGYVEKQVNFDFTRDIGSNLKGTVQLGYSSIDPRRAGVATFNGVTWGADLTLTLADRLQLSAQISRRPLPTLQSDALYAVVRDLSFGATYQLNSRIRLNAGYTNRQRVFQGAGQVPGNIVIVRSASNDYTGGVSYRFNDRLNFALFGKYQQRDANGTAFDYNDTSFGGRFTYRFK